MEKKYYWLKLKDDFFNLTTTKLLRKMPEGDKLTIIYLKLQLLSLKNDGSIIHYKLLPNLSEELAIAIDEESQYVSLTISTLQKLHLIEAISSDEYLLTAMQNLIGSETKSAIQKREYRTKVGQISDKGRTNIGQKKDNVLELSDRDREEIEIDKDIELDKIEIKNKNENAENIINYFNNKMKLKIKGSKEILLHIDLILKEYTIDDFYAVIDYITTDKWYLENKQATLSVICRPTKFYEKLERAKSPVFNKPQTTQEQLLDLNKKVYKPNAF